MFSKARSSHGVNKYQDGACMTLGCAVCLSLCLDCLQSHLAPASHRAEKLNHSWGNVQYFICTTEGRQEGKDQPIIGRQMDREPRVHGEKDLRLCHGKVPVIVEVYYLARGNCTLCHPQALNGNYQVKLTKWDVVTKPPFRDKGWQWAGDGWGLKLVLREWEGQCHRLESLKGVQWRPVSGLPVWQMDLPLWSWRVQEPHWLTKKADGDA